MRKGVERKREKRGQERAEPKNPLGFFIGHPRYMRK